MVRGRPRGRPGRPQGEPPAVRGRRRSPASSPTRRPAGSPTGSTSRGRATSSTPPAPRRWWRSTWRRGRWPSGGPTWRSSAGSTSRPTSISRWSSASSGPSRDRAGPGRSRPTPTGRSRARGWASSSSSGWPTPSATATGSTPCSRGSGSPATAGGSGLAAPERPGARPGDPPGLSGVGRRPGDGRPGRGARPGRARRPTGPSSGPSGRVFPPTAPGRRVLGAVSSLIGHAMPAAGMAGLIKAALALHHRVLPPTLHADRPHPLLDRRRQPVRAQPHGPPLGPRRPADAPAGGRQRLRLRRDQRPRRPGGASRLGRRRHARLPAPLGYARRSCSGPPTGPAWLDLARPLLGWLEREPRRHARRTWPSR